MKKQKIVFLIPGFRHKITQKGYVELSKRLRRNGYQTVSVAIPWGNTTITENIEFFLKNYKRRIAKFSGSADVYFLGFSFGALIALIAATKVAVSGLFLCSLSPFFKEDLPKHLPKKISSLQEKRYKDFSLYHSKRITKKVKAKNVLMLYGAKESVRLVKRSRQTFGTISAKSKFLFSIHKTEHDISDKKYVNAVHFATSFL